MNPGLVIKLRPAGPWRIGPDSGARNRVDVIYHSDSLYSAVTSAMARLGGLEEWLDATARAVVPAVSFSSCFPFLDEIDFVIPPRTMWPPTLPSLMSAAVRWKSARFVPLTVVQALLAGRPLDKHKWAVDGASACLVPTGKPGPFRTGVRWSAAVDRLSGAAERHGTACIEFRSGAGLWTVVSFSSDAARDRWQDSVKAAFRLLADTGFGGERSRGWGRAEAPEFTEGLLPALIVGTGETEDGAGGQGSGVGEAQAPSEASVVATTIEPLVIENATAEGPTPVPPIEEPPPAEPPAADPDPVPEPQPPLPEPEPYPPAPSPVPPLPDPLPARSAAPGAESEPEAPTPDHPRPLTPGEAGFWLLSLFAPAPADTVDWARGSYIVLSRGGRVESPAGSGELKKQVRMVAEGSVLYAGAAPCGAAPDVAPDGFAHPVFRAGFALAIPLPEVR